MEIASGVLYHFIGGFSSGSFYLPFKRVRVWAWESYWIVGGLFSWLIVPWLAAALTVPDFLDIIRATAGSTLGWTYLFGLLWGIGGMTFGLSLRYLGMSLGMSARLSMRASGRSQCLESMRLNLSKSTTATTRQTRGISLSW